MENTLIGIKTQFQKQFTSVYFSLSWVVVEVCECGWWPYQVQPALRSVNKSSELSVSPWLLFRGLMATNMQAYEGKHDV